MLMLKDHLGFCQSNVRFSKAKHNNCLILLAQIKDGKHQDSVADKLFETHCHRNRIHLRVMLR